MPILIAIPFARQLFKKKVLVPRGFGWWILFLIWVAAGVFLLWANAPDAVPGGGPGRLLVFFYRCLWYASCTIALLWILNARKDQVSDSWIVRLLGWMFVVTVGGGLLGMIAPRFEVTSLVEMILPSSIRSNSFISSLVHPAASSLTNFLGREEFRPMAPFSYANSWGSNLSMYLPFFVLGWIIGRRGWQRILGVLVLIAAVPPVVYSMNRGLWASLGVGALILVVYLILRVPRKQRLRLIASLSAALIIGAVGFSMSPLADSATERLDNAHSNERRAQLLTLSAVSAATGSPVAGFGTTRDVQGNFASIAGGGSADCSACRVPPLGTQGHIWLVVFTQGVVGLVFFLAFFLHQGLAFLRARTHLQLLALSVLTFFALQMFIYDTLGTPLLTIMLAIGLAWREYHDTHPGSLRELGSYFPHNRTSKFMVAGTVACGLLVGGAITGLRPPVYSAQTSILLAPTPLHLSAIESSSPRSITVDTEAALVLADRTVRAVQTRYPELGYYDLRERVEITATANTRILHLKFTDSDLARAVDVTDMLSRNYLQMRQEYLTDRRNQILNELQDQLLTLDVVNTAEDGDPNLTADESRRVFQETVIDLTVSDTTAGQVLRAPEGKTARNQPEVLIVSLGLVGLLGGLALHRFRNHSAAAIESQLSRGTKPRRTGQER
ncbi:hypothetical protein [Glutamicibacter uratoxydans]|uniref:O-antigen ligase family protein n=1 Tax=Glutamicibacter uratoxydans TaxID=43667 RepID=UPI003D6F17DA